jgi:hypothetical protein
MTYNGTAWDSMGNVLQFSDGGVQWPSMIESGGDFYVVYGDLNSSGQATVMKSVGGSGNWTPVGQKGFSAGPVRYTRIANNGSTLYVGYIDESLGNKAVVMSSTGGGSWTPVGSAGGISADTADYFAIAVDSNANNPLVAFTDHANARKLTVLRFNGTSWEPVGQTGISDSTVKHISLATYNSDIYAGFQDVAQSNAVTVMRFVTSWQVVGQSGFSAGYATNIKLVIDNGTPYVAYMDPSRATVMKYSGSWQPVGQPRFSEGAANWLSLAVDNGVPYIAFMDVSNDHRVTVMKWQ